MQLTITRRIFLAILTAACLTVVSLVLILKWNVDRGFLRYINTNEQAGLPRLAAKLEFIHAAAGSFDALKNNQAACQELVLAIPPGADGPPLFAEAHPPRPPRDDGVKPPPHQRPLHAQSICQRLFLLDATRQKILGPSEIPAGANATTLHAGNRVIGFIGILPLTQIVDDHQRRFIQEQLQALVLVAAVVVLLAAALSLLLSRRLVRPLQQLANATHRLTTGEFATRVPVTAHDELGQLSRDFNTLAATLEKNEQARRQWVADISHELRTPVAILRGEIEALQDGIRQPTADSFSSLHSEALRLGMLVDDLYQLAMSDVGALTYRKAELCLAEVLAETLNSFRTEFRAKGISLHESMDAVGAEVFGDGERLHQLFSNLLENSLKYTNAGGELQIHLTATDGGVTLDLQDSVPGVPSTELERLFERLYRVESSRNRATGGAGLGLAICRNIVEAHDGTITAQPSPLGGVWIKIELPQADR